MQTTVDEQVNGRELVARFWQEQMKKHPHFYAGLNITKGVLEFFFGGHVVPWLLYKVLNFSSRVADGVLLAAALWITAVRIEPEFMMHLVGGSVQVANLSALSLLAFSLLPELITVAALVITIKHSISFFKRPAWGNIAGYWAILYAIPTLTFLSMTIWMISSFVSSDGATAQLTGPLLVTRCLAALGYSIIEILFFMLGKHGMMEADEKAKLRTEISHWRAAHQTTSQELANLRTSHEGLSAQNEELRSEVLRLKVAQSSQAVPSQPAQEFAAKPEHEADAQKPEKQLPKPVQISDKINARKERDAKIMEMYATMSNRQIAQDLGVSEATVRNVLAQAGVKRSQESGEIPVVNG